MEQNSIPLEAQIRKNQAKVPPRQQHENNFQKLENDAKTEAHNLKNHDFTLEILHF